MGREHMTNPVDIGTDFVFGTAEGTSKTMYHWLQRKPLPGGTRHETVMKWRADKNTYENALVLAQWAVEAIGTRILVCHEKHSNREFDVTTNEQFARTVLYILAERFFAGYWYSKPEKPEPLDFESVDSLPKSMRGEAEKKLVRYQQSLNQYNEEVETYNYILRALRDKNAALAWYVLSNREGEYERVEISGPTVVSQQELDTLLSGIKKEDLVYEQGDDEESDNFY